MNTINVYDPKVMERWVCSIISDLDSFDRLLDADCTEAKKSAQSTVLNYKRSRDDRYGAWFLFLSESQIPLASLSATIWNKDAERLEIQIDRYETDSETNQESSIHLACFFCEKLKEYYQIVAKAKTTKPLSLNDYK